VFARLCEAKAEIRGIDAAAIALSSGQAETSKDATAHGKFIIYCGWNCELSGIADAAIA